MNFEKKFSSLPQFKPEACQSPSAISVPSSPRVYVQSYRKKPQNSHGSIVDEESESEASVLNSAKSTSGGKLVGSTFFGPDFNVESFRGRYKTFQHIYVLILCFLEINENTEGNSPRTPKTPSTSRDTDKGHRRTLEQRRNLVMKLFQEFGFFPSQQATSNFQVSIVNNYVYYIILIYFCPTGNSRGYFSDKIKSPVED